MTVFQKATTMHQPGTWFEPTPAASPRVFMLSCPNCRCSIPVKIDPSVVTPDATGQTVTMNSVLSCPAVCGFSEEGVQITGL